MSKRKAQEKISDTFAGIGKFTLESRFIVRRVD
jgi:hypothetical protein